LQAKYDAQSLFARTAITNESVVKKIAAILDNGQLASFESDIMGGAFEYFNRNNALSKQNLGQYFTPYPIVKVMVALAAPTGQDTIYDPFCGGGGLLVGCASHIKGLGGCPKETMFFGKDASPSARAAKMNAILHWNSHKGIEQVDNTLAHPVQRQYSVGLTNVPFARDPKNYQYDGLYENGLARKKTDVLCILHLFQAIQKGGRLVAIVPEGFLCGTEREDARRFLTDNADLRLVVSLPHGMFAYTEVKTAIIYFENIHCPTKPDYFWSFDVHNDGGASNNPGKQTGGRNALDILCTSFREASEEGMISLGFTKVPFEKIRANHGNWIGNYSASNGAGSPYPLVPLGKLVTCLPTGFSYKASQLADNGIPLFTLKSVRQGFLSYVETKFLKMGVQTQEKNACAKGDILVALKDTHIASVILGRAAMADRQGIFAYDLVKVEVDAEGLLLPEYLYYLFKNETWLKAVKKLAVGSIVKSISLEDFAALQIPLPPIAVQQETVNEFKVYEKMLLSQNETARFFQERYGERVRSLWG
jgi:hypothetical protein